MSATVLYMSIRWTGSLAGPNEAPRATGSGTAGPACTSGVWPAAADPGVARTSQTTEPPARERDDVSAPATADAPAVVQATPVSDQFSATSSRPCTCPAAVRRRSATTSPPVPSSTSVNGPERPVNGERAARSSGSPRFSISIVPGMTWLRTTHFAYSSGDRGRRHRRARGIVARRRLRGHDGVHVVDELEPGLSPRSSAPSSTQWRRRASTGHGDAVAFVTRARRTVRRRRRAGASGATRITTACRSTS